MLNIHKYFREIYFIESLTNIRKRLLPERDRKNRKIRL